MTDYACLMLPFPPTTNNLFSGKQKRFPSKAYKAWRDEATFSLMQQKPLPIFKGPVALTLALARPDKRLRDVSNYIKAVEDCLVEYGVLQDDSLVQDVRAYWAGSDEVQKGVRVSIATQYEQAAGFLEIVKA